jgi:flagellar motor switch/type III secretory pathway protein FliN
MLTIQQLESTTPNHRRRPSTIKLLAPVTVDISVSMGSSELKMKSL